MANLQIPNTTELFKTMSSDELTTAIIKLVWEDERAMPAVFTSNGNKVQSFCVDFEDIDPGDEYQMASASWHWVGQHMKSGNNFTEEQLMTIIRCGEDIMISSYIVQKVNRIEVQDQVVSKLTEMNKKSWPDNLDSLRVFETESAKNWFDYCKGYGVQVAQGKYV